LACEMEEVQALAASSRAALATECELNAEHTRVREDMGREVARLKAEHQNWVEAKAKLELRVANLTIENDELAGDAQDAKTNAQGMVEKLQSRMDELERVCFPLLPPPSIIKD
jgi:FtsZ-binding cell division protein ZapB